MEREAVLRALAAVKDPDSGRDIVSSGFVKEVKVSGDAVAVLLAPNNPTPERLGHFRMEVTKAFASLSKNVSVDFTPATQPAQKQSSLERIKNVVAVASGKGGVGKSTIAIYLALALAAKGNKVGLLDADIYGASAHLMLRPSGQLESSGNRLIPPSVKGVKMMSMGYFSQTENPVIWRGPLVGKAVRDFVELTEWGDLDFLVVDLPPGCVGAGTRIMLEDGSEVQVQDLQEGSRVVCFDGNRLVSSTVEQVIPQGLQFVYELKAGGSSILATANHPFLCSDTEGRTWWKSLADLRKGDIVVAAVREGTVQGAGLVSEVVATSARLLEVQSVEPVGTKETYDLQVSNHHNFVAQGFIVHNTGDAPLTLAQTLPVRGVILVTTPQEAALRVAAKSYYMFQKLQVDVIGVVENMSYFVCPHCGMKSEIFGSGGGRKLAEQLGVELLGEVPLLPAVRESGDEGVPIDSSDETTSVFNVLADKVLEFVKRQD